MDRDIMEKIKILCIEDDENQRKQLSRDLRARGFSVTPAKSGRTGLTLFENRRFDAVLCDLNMPGIDGLQVLDRVKRKDPEIPVVILTAHGAVSHAVKAIKKGAHHFILKPLEIDEIVVTITQAIEQSQLQKKFAESQAMLRMVAENIPDIIYSLNIRGEFVSISPAAEPVLGYKPLERIGTSVFEIIHPDDIPRIKEMFSESVKTGKPRVKLLKMRMITRSGDVKHFEVSRKLVFEKGRVVRFDGTARDITESMYLEKQLEEYSRDLEIKNVKMQRLLKEISKHKDELQVIIDASPSVIFLVDDEGFVKAANGNVTRYFGIPVDEVIQSSVDDFLRRVQGSFEEPGKFLKHIERLKKTPDCAGDCAGQIDLTELYNRGVRVKGSFPIILSPMSMNVFDRAGNIVGRLWLLNDITTLKHAEEQIHTIVKASPIPTIISRIQDGTILYANEELADLLGTTARELIGRKTPDFYYDLEDRKKVIESLKHDGYLKNFEVRIKRIDGSVIWMLFSLVITQIGGEQVILGGLYDISEKKEAEEALRVSEVRFRSLVENAEDVIYSATPTGEFSYISPKFTDVLGYEVSDFIGKPVYTLFHPDDRSKAREWFEGGLMTNKEAEETGFRMVHRDGSVHWFISHASVINDEKGDIIEVIGVAHDITEMKKILNDLEEANRHLRETQSQLAQSEKMASLGTLVAGIAHEINTPIGAVSSMHDTLFRTLEKLKAIIETKFSGDHEEISQLMASLKIIDDANKVIRPGTERVINIVRRLRSFARLDEAELKIVDIHEGIEDTLTLIHHELKHDITVHRNYGDIPAISCFPGQLNQVFLNLFINARQAIKGKGEITITTSSDDTKILITITDTGEGITAENLGRVFDPGFTTKGVGIGTGLGLSICYQIIQDHRGEIRVESEVGKGTTFTIFLPTNLDNILNNT